MKARRRSIGEAPASRRVFSLARTGVAIRRLFHELEEVFLARLAGVRCFCRRDRVGYVAGEGQPDLLRFVGDGEVGLAWEERVDLDEVGALVLEVADGAACLLLVRDPHGARPHGLGPVEERAAGDDPRAHERAGGDPLAPRLEELEVAAHVADAGHAVGDEERQEELLLLGARA